MPNSLKAGDSIGCLTVIERFRENAGYHRQFWVKCSVCGGTFVQRQDRIRSRRKVCGQGKCRIKKGLTPREYEERQRQLFQLVKGKRDRNIPWHYILKEHREDFKKNSSMKVENKDPEATLAVIMNWYSQMQKRTQENAKNEETT